MDDAISHVTISKGYVSGPEIGGPREDVNFDRAIANLLGARVPSNCVWIGQESKKDGPFAGLTSSRPKLVCVWWNYTSGRAMASKEVIKAVQWFTKDGASRKVSAAKEITIGATLGLITGLIWQTYHWNENAKWEAFYKEQEDKQ
eukprot:jgi/Picsp_1/3500/NSC_06338-R1_cytochrome c oxidase polypeptide vc